MQCITQILRTRLLILAPFSLAPTRAVIHLMLLSVWYSHPPQNPSHWLHLFMLHLISKRILCNCPVNMRTSPPLVPWRRIQSPRQLIHSPIGKDVFTTFTALARILASPLGLGYMRFLASAHHFLPLTWTCLHPPLVLSIKRMVSLLSDPSLVMKYIAAYGLTVN